MFGGRHTASWRRWVIVRRAWCAPLPAAMPQIRYGRVLQPLNDLIDAPAAFANFRPGGYSLLGECVHCSVSQKLWINQTWLDKLGP